MIDNPDYKGEWKAPMIDNPDYKGPWEHPMIPNKDYAPETYAKYKDLTTVGFELWTVNGGSIFDNILVTDDKKYADKMAEKTWKKIKGEEGSGEKEAKEAWKKENEPEEEPEDDEDEDDEDDDDSEILLSTRHDVSLHEHYGGDVLRDGQALAGRGGRRSRAAPPRALL